MTTPLNVLIVEDSADDAEMVLRQLRRAGYDPVSERVQTAEEMKTALEREAWDLVVSDYTMPQFAAPAALNLLNQSGRDIPFIVVSGSIGEDIAVTMMKTGAHDYILKQNLTRFVPAVQRELREAENRRQQRLTEQAKQRLQIERAGFLERLKQENEDLAALTQVTANAINTLDLDELLRVLLGRVVEVMHADTATILLAEGAELRVRASVGAVNLSDSTHVKHVGDCLAGTVALRLKPVYVEDAAVDPLITDPLIRERGIRSMLGVPLKRNGTLIGVLHVDWLTVRPCRDREVHLLEITAERCAAAIQNAQLYQEAKRIAAALTESEARFRQLAEHIDEVFWMTDVAKSQMIYISPAYEKVWGRTCAALYASPGAWLDAIHPEDRERIVQSNLTNQTTAAYDEEYRINRPDGTIRWIHDRAFPVRNQAGEIYRIAGVAIDMTERKRAEEALRESEEKYRRLFDSSKDAFMTLVPPDWRFTSGNPSTIAMFRARDEAEFTSKAPWELSPERQPDGCLSAEKAKAMIEQALREGNHYFEWTHKRLDGAEFPATVLLTRLELKGRILLNASVRDITARKQHEDQLRLFRTLLNQSTDAIFVVNPSTARIVDVNDSACTSLGYTREELLVLRVMDIEANFSDFAAYERNTEQLKAAGAFHFEGRQRRKDGSIFPVEVSVRYISRPEGDYSLAIVRDITARKRAEEEKLAILETTIDGFYMVNEEGRILDVNDAYCRMIGYSRDELLKMAIKDFEVLEAEEAIRRKIQQINEVGHLRFETQHRRKDGCVIDIDAICSSLKNDKKKMFVFMRDITERKLAEEARHEALSRFAGFAEASQYGMGMADMDGRILFANPTLIRLLGEKSAAECLGKHFPAYYPPLMARKLQEEVMPALLRDGHWHGELELVTADGRRVPTDENFFIIRDKQGQPRYIADILTDITERRQIERQMLRTQRLESIGTLAAGVAHDLNNSLAPILLGVELIKEQYPQESQIADIFQTSARRGADMVRHLLAFAKGAEGERVILQPGHLVQELEKLMKGSFPKNLQLAVQCDPKLPKVLGDATQLHQMLMNLCVNARDAMPHGGTLTLEAQSMEVDAIYASSLLDGKPGKYVVLRVRDTGTGIPPEIIDRIFDPFFTTKGPDIGTGLGLSTVIGIVKGHGGFLQVDSQPGQGSTFAVYLPAADADNDTEHVTKAVAGFRGQGETILIVEDETSVRKVVCAVLRRLNFNPLAATDGADGLLRAAENRAELRAVITDLHMPHMDGLAFVRALRRMLPDIPVAVASGRMEEAMAEELKTLGVTRWLNKPFTEPELAETLKSFFAPK